MRPGSYRLKDIAFQFAANCVFGSIPTVFLLLFRIHLSPSAMVRDLIVGSVFANAISFPAGLVIPRLYPTITRRGPVGEWTAVLLALVVLGVLGCFLGTTFLALVGFLPWSSFWVNVRFNLSLCLLITLAAGSVATAFGRMQGRLHHQEMERQKALKLATEAQLNSLESRIHPHFLFNTLNSISALIPVDPERAERLMERMAALLRFSLDAHASGLVPLDQEMKIVRDYLEIEQARLGSRLRFEVDSIDAPQLRLPPLAIQTLVENSIKFAVAPQRQGGEIRVRTQQSNGSLRVDVSDTGPGFTLDAVPAGHGLDNLRNRLQVLFGGAADLRVTREDGWTTVTLVTPA